MAEHDLSGCGRSEQKEQEKKEQKEQMEKRKGNMYQKKRKKVTTGIALIAVVMFGAWTIIGPLLPVLHTESKSFDVAVTNGASVQGDDIAIMGENVVGADTLAAFLLSKNSSPKLNGVNAMELAQLYLDEGSAEGVRGDLAFCQSCLETNYWKFTGDVSYTQNNFAGIGAVGGGAAGASFPDAQTGVRAQIQHLKAYASGEGLSNPCVDPRYDLVTKGSASTIGGLAGKWATDHGYGAKILSVYNAVLAFDAAFGGGSVSGSGVLEGSGPSGDESDGAPNEVLMESGGTGTSAGSGTEQSGTPSVGEMPGDIGQSGTFAGNDVLDNIVPTDSTAASFVDVSINSWYFDAVEYVANRGLMQGTSGAGEQMEMKDFTAILDGHSKTSDANEEMEMRTFSPDQQLSRAMLVTILYRMEGSPENDFSAAFFDVSDNEWYTDAIIWASKEGIVNGDGSGYFRPNDAITREQMTTLFCRYAERRNFKVKSVETNIDHSDILATFCDGATVGSYAVEPMKWALGSGLIQGKDDGRLDPLGTATRAETAQFLKNFCENIITDAA